MKNNYSKSEVHELYCTKCGKKGIPILRKLKRKDGHLKRLYCPFCKKVINHVEIAGKYTYDDFLLEFNNGNFTEEGQRRLTINQLKQEVKRKGKLK